jgi:hypothetical protein
MSNITGKNDGVIKLTLNDTKLLKHTFFLYIYIYIYIYICMYLCMYISASNKM